MPLVVVTTLFAVIHCTDTRGLVTCSFQIAWYPNVAVEIYDLELVETINPDFPTAGNYNNYNSYGGGGLDNTGYFGPFFKCIRTGGYGVHCGDNAGQYEIYGEWIY